MHARVSSTPSWHGITTVIASSSGSLTCLHRPSGGSCLRAPRTTRLPRARSWPTMGGFPLPLPHHRFTVADDLHGIALPDFLERQWPEADRKHLRLLVHEGSVQVNRMEKLPARLKAGDLVEVDVPEEGLPAARRHRRASAPAVLYSDPQLLIVDKPAGLPTVPDRAGRPQSVHAMLAELRPGGDLRIVHRLDRDT